MPRIIDVHTHLTPQIFIETVSRGKNWYGMTSEDGELDNPKNLYSIQKRIDEIDVMGLDTQVISPTDVFYQYSQKPEITAKIAQECNLEISEIIKTYPKHFIGLGTLPMQDVDIALVKMKNGIELGLKGFMIDDHVNGLTYDAPIFDSFWKMAEKLNAFILIHQYGPTTVESRTKKYFLPNTVGNLVDRTITYGCLVCGGVMDRYPNLKICLAHAGGYVPFAVDRMDKGWKMFPKYRGKAENPPSKYLKRFYYDTTTFTDRNLRFLVDVVGADRVLLGSDWPAPMAVNNPVRTIQNSSVLSEEEKEAILWENVSDALH